MHHKYLNKIITGNSIDLMKTLPDKSIDVIITDPPYGVGLDYDVYEDTEENWKTMFCDFVPEAKRVSSMTIMPSCRIMNMPFIYATHPPDWLICWHKGSPGTSAYIGFNDWEPLLVYGKTNGLQMHDYMSVTNTEKMGKYGHPCPKPLAWAKWLVDRAVKEGGLVLDPFMGSGTTAVACVELGRNFIGFELSEEYTIIAQKRVASANKPLFQAPQPKQKELM